MQSQKGKGFVDEFSVDYRDEKSTAAKVEKIEPKKDSPASPPPVQREEAAERRKEKALSPAAPSKTGIEQEDDEPFIEIVQPRTARKPVQKKKPVYDDGQDLLSGGDILTEEDAPEEEEEQFMRGSARELKEVLRTTRPRKKRHGHRRYGVAAGSFVLIFALIGVVFLAVFIGGEIHKSMTDDSELRAYDKFLAPVVLLDPKPFDSPERADETMVMTASLWRAIGTKGGDGYTTYDDEGRTTVPLSDVTLACEALFGPDCQLSAKTPDEDTFFEFNDEDSQFHVVPYSTLGAYTPYVESSYRDGDALVLRVGYLSPVDEPQANESGEAASEVKPTKVMEYVMKTNPESGERYIYAIREVAD